MSVNDNVAISTILARYVRAIDLRDAQQKVVAEANARLMEHVGQVANLKSAFLAFGHDITKEGIWDRVREQIGSLAYNQAVAEGKNADAAIEQDEADADDIVTDDEPEVAETVTPKVRDAVLSRLRAAGSSGAKATELRQFYETTFSTKLHEKTIGMTLYRLSKDDLVRREGRTWFYVPPQSETKNPGGGTPGHIDAD